MASSKHSTDSAEGEWRNLLRMAIRRRMEVDDKESMSRHVFIRNLTSDWMSREEKLRNEMETIVSDQNRRVNGRKEALWKSWVFHVVTPIANSLQNRLNKKCLQQMNKTRRSLYQKYLEFSKNPNHVLKLDVLHPELYDPFVLRKDNLCIRYGARLDYRDPFLTKWKDFEEEKEFVRSDWPLDSKPRKKSKVKLSSRERRGSRVGEASGIESRRVSFAMGDG